MITSEGKFLSPKEPSRVNRNPSREFFYPGKRIEEVVIPKAIAFADTELKYVKPGNSALLTNVISAYSQRKDKHARRVLKLRNAAKTVNRTETIMKKCASTRSFGMNSNDRDAINDVVSQDDGEHATSKLASPRSDTTSNFRKNLLNPKKVPDINFLGGSFDFEGREHELNLIPDENRKVKKHFMTYKEFQKLRSKSSLAIQPEGFPKDHNFYNMSLNQLKQKLKGQRAKQNVKKVEKGKKNLQAIAEKVSPKKDKEKSKGGLGGFLKKNVSGKSFSVKNLTQVRVQDKANFMKSQIENWCWGRLLPQTEEEVKISTPFSKLYPGNEKFEAITMKSREIVPGFSSFSKAKSVGHIRKWTHLKEGRHRDPLEVDRMLFAKRPELKEFVRNQPQKAPKVEEVEDLGRLTTAGKKSYLIYGKQFRGLYDRIGESVGSHSAWVSHTGVEGQVLGNLRITDNSETFTSVGLHGHAVDHKKLRRGYRKDRQDCLVFEKHGGDHAPTGRDGGIKLALN